MGTNTKKRRAARKQMAVVVILLAAAGAWLYERYTRLEEEGLVSCYFEGGSAPMRFKLELASTPTERTKGLMFRHSLPENHGMIFIYPSSQENSFWMKDTYIPLDMIFLDEAFKVVGVLEDVPVNNEKPRTVGKPSQYVVELAAGSAKRAGVAAGSVLKCEGPLPRGL